MSKQKDLFGNEPSKKNPTVKDLGKALLLPKYEEQFANLEKIAYELHKMEFEELEKAVIKKMAGIKMMIDYLK